ncbi:hypothetical protein [Halosimplex salinum]|uniref:hypothetical protein n=1 Tax=Halosimplex salinum TaxID=1710538 RepID=UPI000F4750A4|nr:hypothetical protein [Halosimplex salinum]
MVNTAYLASTVVMGLLGVGVFVLAQRLRGWEHYTPRVAYGDIDAGHGRPATGLAGVAGRTSTWTAAYIVLVLGFLLGATVYASGAITGPSMIAALGALVAVYLVGGIYFAMREHGRPSAQAAAGSAVATGMLFVVAITVLLVVS